MHKLTILTLAAASLALPACTPSERAATDLPPGQYHRTTKSVDSAGTGHTTKETTTVGEDAYGNKSAVVTKKKTTDPKGLFNKRTSESTSVYSEEN